MTSLGTSNRFPWENGLFDAHCHPTDNLASLQKIPGMRAKVLTVMATRAQDQQLVADAADAYGVTMADFSQTDMDWSKDHKIVPAFGWHPWFSHQMFDESEYGQAKSLDEEDRIAHYRKVLKPEPEDYKFLSSLPEPISFGHFISETRSYLQRYPLALVGEIGLDKGFRLPEAWLKSTWAKRDDKLTPGGREGRALSPYRVDMDHQKKVLLAQLQLAGEMGRACSVHGVQAHGVLYDTLCLSWKGHEKRVLSNREKKMYRSTGELPEDMVDYDSGAEEVAPSTSKPFPPRLCLHSFSGTPETVKQYLAPSIPCEIFFSFSKAINAWAQDDNGKVEAAVKLVPDDKILIESDLDEAGQNMDDYLREVALKICRIKGWTVDAGVLQLRNNWRRFVLGDE